MSLLPLILPLVLFHNPYVIHVNHFSTPNLFSRWNGTMAQALVSNKGWSQ